MVVRGYYPDFVINTTPKASSATALRLTEIMDAAAGDCCIVLCGPLCKSAPPVGDR